MIFREKTTLEDGTEAMTLDFASYQKLLKASLWKNALQNGGVDNWDWYDDAMEEYETAVKELGLESD